ncbi:hypothetical protein B0H10DRAFT_2262139 [Mycena sp. CBHHK59/15]|nr:hypothetical protein B0H10DRAFT_2262139 [Mycena sp. CBHHK59/15]
MSGTTVSTREIIYQSPFQHKARSEQFVRRGSPDKQMLTTFRLSEVEKRHKRRRQAFRRSVELQPRLGRAFFGCEALHRVVRHPYPLERQSDIQRRAYCWSAENIVIWDLQQRRGSAFHVQQGRPDRVISHPLACFLSGLDISLVMGGVETRAYLALGGHSWPIMGSYSVAQGPAWPEAPGLGPAWQGLGLLFSKPKPKPCRRASSPGLRPRPGLPRRDLPPVSRFLAADCLFGPRAVALNLSGTISASGNVAEKVLQQPFHRRKPDFEDVWVGGQARAYWARPGLQILKPKPWAGSSLL